jgi:HAD superfamily hydrolase (TIGR01458 family)
VAALHAVLLDVDGVLVNFWKPLPGAVDAIRDLRDLQVPFRLVTNTSQFDHASLAEMLRDGGFDVRDEEVMTATTATASYLQKHHPGARCYLLATGKARADLGDLNEVEEGAEIVVIGDAEDGFNYENLNRAFRMIMDGATLVAMHRGLFWITDDGPALDVGAFVAGLEEAARVEAVVTGKPSPAFFEAALGSLGLPAHEVLMVGDDVQSDVNAATALGLVGALVRTGKFRDSDLERLELPAHVIDSVAGVPGLLV